ncbi:phage major capsid protein [Oceanobacillus kimchii]|uniref:phage major capsid protein n=1 Tax=Oceanobacillus kimchii TaxID=746691 RepID=UPI0021A3FC55|nr:phage major capsid protein [Oceanobacillus kimchii]MCT1575693.1 phage major capsid protein [Oceanobacillus kimchii]MCT2137323.1 phage major capsid protein [Oceanobacillus kimchii]
MKTLYELKQNLSTVGQQLQKVENELASAAIDTDKSTEDIKNLQNSRDDLKMRFDVIKEQHDQLEQEQKTKFDQKDDIKNIADPTEKKMKAKADFIKAVMKNEPVPNDVRLALGDDVSTGGGKFLPKTVSNDIITEPTVKNQLRGLSTFTQITNLEIPKISFTLDDDDFIADKETAKELKAKGDTVSFGRNKFKVFSGISETVLLGTNSNIVSTVDKALESGVAAKEKKVAFSASPKTGEGHMSFYSEEVGIKEVSGAEMFEAITNAIDDLHEDYRDNATIVMRKSDYTKIIKTLANGNATLYGAQPEQVLGKPVVFVDAAVDPIVGDFSYSHYNYDIATTQYERDKDVKTGIEQFVVTAWFDHQIKLASAFRIAKVATP